MIQKMPNQFLMLGTVAICWWHCLSSDSTYGQDLVPPVLTLFESHVAGLDGLDDPLRNKIKQTIDHIGHDSVGDAITESLILIYPRYEAAIDATDSDDLGLIMERLGQFVQATDPFLTADASFYLARSLMNHEKYELAYPLLELICGQDATHSAHLGAAHFYLGVAQAGLLNYPKAIQTLTNFLDAYPEAPERLRIAAWRQVQQLRTIKGGGLEDIYQRMDFSRRQLSLIEPGEVTQEEQRNILSMLAKLIRDQQKQETSKSSSDQNQKNTQQRQPQQSQQAQSQQQNQSQQGGSSNNPNGQVVHRSYDDGPASPWSRLRDRSRDPANNAIKDKLPARYREIVERYYEAASGESKR